MPIQKEIYKVAVQSTVRSWRYRFGRYALVGCICPTCDVTYYPQRRICPTCHNRELPEKMLSRTGTVVSWAVNYLATMGFMEAIPTVRAFIQLDDHGPVIFSDIVDCDPDSIQEGTRVEMVVRRVKRESNGNLQYAHKWRPISRSQS